MSALTWGNMPTKNFKDVKKDLPTQLGASTGAAAGVNSGSGLQSIADNAIGGMLGGGGEKEKVNLNIKPVTTLPGGFGQGGFGPGGNIIKGSTGQTGGPTSTSTSIPSQSTILNDTTSAGLSVTNIPTQASLQQGAVGGAIDSIEQSFTPAVGSAIDFIKDETSVAPVSAPTIQTLPTQFSTEIEQEPAKYEAPTYQTTELGDEALDKFSEYALADEDPQVTAERKRLERNSVMQAQQAKRQAHENAIRNGFQPGTQQYEQMMRDAVSDARTANTTQMNAFNDFARARRSDQQAELEGLASGEFSRLGTEQQREQREFENLVKFLPSDIAQQALAVGQAQGVDLKSSFTNMYNSDGTLKPEYQDKTQPELIKQGIEQAVGQMTTNPDTNEAWKGTEQQDYINKFYNDNFQNILYPAQTQSEQITEEKAASDRIGKFLSSGDASEMADSDWSTLTTTQLKEAKDNGYIIENSSFGNKGDNWDYMDNIGVVEARERWLKRNPISNPENKGKIIEKNGKLYELTVPLETRKTGDNHKLYVMGKDLVTGEEVVLSNSSEFDEPW